MTCPADSLEAASPVRLSTRYKVSWGVAALGTQLSGCVYGALLPIFYQDYLGLQARWIGTASLVYAIWNAINDPLFGYLTDGTRSRLGRRIPYMRFTAPLLGLAFALIWLAPTRVGQRALFWWMLGAMLFYDTCYTIIGLAYAALLPEVSESDAERNALQISSSLFGLVGMLLGFVIPDAFRPRDGASQSFLSLRVSMIVVALVSVALVMYTTYRVRERPEFHLVDRPLRLLSAIRHTLASRAFFVLVAQNFLSVLMVSLVLGTLFYLADYVLQVSVILPLMCLVVPLIFGVPATSVVRRWLGVVGAQQLLLALAGIALILVAVVPVQAVPVCLVVAGFGLAGPHTLTNVLFAQVVDEDELRSGVRREGAFFGVNALVTKPAQSVALALIPAILERTGFVARGANQGRIVLSQPPAASLGIRSLTGLIPGVAMLAGAAILFLYPLRGARLRDMQRRVLSLHASKRARLPAVGDPGRED